MKASKVKTLAVYFFMLLLCSCGLFIDKECFDNNYYKFYLPFTLTPAQDTFQINDTIQVYADFSNMFLDSNSLKYYLVEDEPLYCYFAIIRLDTFGLIFPYYNFTLLVDTGDINASSDPGQGLRLFKYVYADNRYKFYIKLVPHVAGIYWLGFGSFDEQEVDLQKRCPSEIMEVFFTLNDGIDNNYPLLLQSPDSIISSISKHIFDIGGGYAFHVVE